MKEVSRCFIGGGYDNEISRGISEEYAHSSVIVGERGKYHRSVIVCCFCIWEQLKLNGFFEVNRSSVYEYS